MITIPDLIRMLDIQHGLIHRQTEGLTQADSLIQPQPSGNCMNWVLGHTLWYYISFLELLDAESPIQPSEIEAYQRESSPITGEGPGVLSLARLLEYHDQVHSALIKRLPEMDEADFSRQIESQGRSYTLGWRVFFIIFHNSYHIGQLELLRQMAGRTDKVI